jgi:hypothetical protein
MQTDINGIFIKCFTPNFQYYSGNELRIGDRITFYPQTISNMLKSPYLAVQSKGKKQFVQALLTGTFTILDQLDYIPNADGIYEPRPANQRTQPYVSSYNGFVITNFFTKYNQGNVLPSYPDSIDETTFTILEPNILVGSNLEFLNVSLQPVYTLELDILQPDTATIGGKIVL